jgi:hypothetical protein
MVAMAALKEKVPTKTRGSTNQNRVCRDELAHRVFDIDVGHLYNQKALAIWRACSLREMRHQDAEPHRG